LVPPAAPDYLLEGKLQETHTSTIDVFAIIDSLISNGAQILYTRYIESQKIPYASRTLSRELVLNASWASMPLDSRSPIADPDSDLALPAIDEWAGGVLPVRGSDPSSLRCSVTPQREVRRTQTLRRPLALLEEPPPPRERPKAAASVGRPAGARPAREGRAVAIVITEGERITKAFEEARKRTNVPMKAITVDSDFTVIQIAEPKGLPPALIVPKVVTRSRPPQRPSAAIAARPIGPPTAKKDTKRRKVPPLLQPDVPAFDEEVAAISYSDRFVCAPGVTFKDGATVKSRPPVVNTTQMTRAQYDAYLQEMMRNGEA
jgi:hypothetical protein